MFGTTTISTKHLMSIDELVEREIDIASRQYDLEGKPGDFIFGIDSTKEVVLNPDKTPKLDKSGNPIYKTTRIIQARDKSLNKDFIVDDTALRHFCSKVNVPKSSLKRLDDFTASQVLNQLLPKSGLAQQEHRYRAERTNDTEHLRGVLTTGYKPFDILPALEMLRGVLDDTWGVSRYSRHDDIVSFGLTSDLTTSVVVGEPCRKGIYFRNSELGFSSFELLLFVYIGRCSNGQISPQQRGRIRFPHTGKVDHYEEVKKLITSSEGVWRDIGDVYKRSEEIFIEDPEFFMMNIAKKFDLSKHLRKEIFDKYYHGPKDKTQLRSIIDAYTEAAHKLFDLKSDNYRKLEGIGADLTEEWQKFMGKEGVASTLPEGPIIDMVDDRPLLLTGGNNQ